MMIYVTRALALNVLHCETKMKPVKTSEGKSKHYQKRNQKYALLETMLLDLNGLRVAQVESFDLNAFGISQTEETRTMENPTFTALGNPRNGISSIFDCEVSCVTPNPVGVEDN
jgi:hypothetical protein